MIIIIELILTIITTGTKTNANNIQQIWGPHKPTAPPPSPV